MPEYDVEVERIGYGYLTIRVTASSEEEAKEKAIDEAYNESFSEYDADYNVVEDVAKLVDEDDDDA